MSALEDRNRLAGAGLDRNWKAVRAAWFTVRTIGIVVLLVLVLRHII